MLREQARVAISGFGSIDLGRARSEPGHGTVGIPIRRCSRRTTRAPDKRKPIDLDVEAASSAFTRDIAKFLNDFHDEYRGHKKALRRDDDLRYSMLVSMFPQWGTSNGGPGVVQLAYDTNIIWSPFKIRLPDRERSPSRRCKPSTGPRPTPSRDKLG